MEADPPAPPPRRPSLFAQAARWRVRGWDGGHGIALAIAACMMLGPLLTIVGGHLLTRSIRAETSRIGADARSRLAAQEGAAAARDPLRAALAMPTLGATLDGLARTLPPETTLVAVERRASGSLLVEAATADPDRLRSALRRDPATATLRDAGQRRGQSAMLVTFEGPQQ